MQSSISADCTAFRVPLLEINLWPNIRQQFVVHQDHNFKINYKLRLPNSENWKYPKQQREYHKSFITIKQIRNWNSNYFDSQTKKQGGRLINQTRGTYCTKRSILFSADNYELLTVEDEDDKLQFKMICLGNCS